jgi:DNA repair protein RadA
MSMTDKEYSQDSEKTKKSIVKKIKLEDIQGKRPKEEFEKASKEVGEEADFDLADLPGIGTVRKNRLLEKGIRNMMDLVVNGPVEISAVTGMDLVDAEVLVNNALKFLQDKDTIRKSFMSGEELLDYRANNIQRLSTGSNAFDKMLKGGIETQSITEVYSLFGGGKTQLCFSTCVMAQMPRNFCPNCLKTFSDGSVEICDVCSKGKDDVKIQHGLEGTVVYIDTENTFRPERIIEIAKARGFAKTPEEAQRFLKGIIVAKAYNASHQQLISDQLGEILEKQKGESGGIKLLIIDSVTAHFRAEYLGRGMLAPRQNTLGKHIHKVLRTAENYNLAVIVTNQVMANPEGFGDPVRPVGGNVLAHTSTYRIYLKKSGKKHIARIDDSPLHPQVECLFALGEQGITDAEDD